MANKNFVGPMIRAIRNRLKESGVSEDVISKAVSFGPRREKSLRFSRTVKKRIQSLLVNPKDKCILTLGYSGKIRVLSMEGHEALKVTAAHAREGKANHSSRSAQCALAAKARWAKWRAAKEKLVETTA